MASVPASPRHAAPSVVTSVEQRGPERYATVSNIDEPFAIRHPPVSTSRGGSTEPQRRANGEARSQTTHPPWVLTRGTAIVAAEPRPQTSRRDETSAQPMVLHVPGDSVDPIAVESITASPRHPIAVESITSTVEPPVDSTQLALDDVRIEPNEPSAQGELTAVSEAPRCSSSEALADRTLLERHPVGLPISDAHVLSDRQSAEDTSDTRLQRAVANLLTMLDPTHDGMANTATRHSSERRPHSDVLLRRPHSDEWVETTRNVQLGQGPAAAANPPSSDIAIQPSRPTALDQASNDRAINHRAVTANPPLSARERRPPTAGRPSSGAVTARDIPSLSTRHAGSGAVTARDSSSRETAVAADGTRRSGPMTQRGSATDRGQTVRIIIIIIIIIIIGARRSTSSPTKDG